MKFEFSDEQEALRSEARRFLSKECTSAVVRGVLESDRPFDAGLWRGIAALGWTGVALPEEHGGSGAGYLELCVIAEELGRALAPVPFSSTVYLATEFLLHAATPSQRQTWLPRIASGSAIGALALAEGPGRHAWHSSGVQARDEGGSVRLHGVKTPVLDGLAADFAVVPASGLRGVQLHLVELNQPGVSRSAEPGIDESRPLARLEFQGARAEVLGSGDLTMLQGVLNRAAVLFAFEQLGGAEAALRMAVAYAKDRFAFGRPIGSFQAIKHRLADMYCELELARSNCYLAAWALSTAEASLPEAAACAQLSASGAYFTCAKECIQIHGGIGFTWALDAHLYYRRARLLGSVIGGAPRWREALVQALARRDEGKRGAVH